MIERLESRLLLTTILNGRPVPDPQDENIYFRLPLDADTTTHFYFDRDPTSAAHAWDGSTHTYDGHTGSDFSGGPEGKPVYAAADGILAYKEDGWPPGYPNSGGTANGNYVKLVHGNDRNGEPIVTFYLHFLAGTVTTKPIGSFIAAGEQIGGVGTTGNSTGDHLHFQPDYAGAVFDPFAAAGETSWWVNQGTGSPAKTTPPHKFNVGDYVQVFALAGGTLNVRSPNPDSSTIGTEVDGAIGQVTGAGVLSYTGGDYNNNVYTRYKVKFANGLEGWAAQNWMKLAPAQEIAVAQGVTNITDGQAGSINFGSVHKGDAGPTLIFTVMNSGNQNLTLGSPTLPAGYTLVEGLTSPLAPGASDTFTIRLDSATIGTKSGQLSFVNNDGDENPFNFPITGIVLGDTTPPTADITDVSPDPYSGPLNSISIVFSEPVFNFGFNDLSLSRNGGMVMLSPAQTFTTSDNITWTIGNLGPLTAASGTYTFTVLTGAVNDSSGNALITPASDTVKIQTSLFRGDATGVTADAYYLRRSTDGTKVEIFENQPIGPTPTYVLLWAGLSALTFDTQGGNNTVTIDYTNGNPIPAGAGGFSYLAGNGNNTLNLNGVGSFTLFADASLAAPNLTINASTTGLYFAATQRLAALNLDHSSAAMTGSGKFLIAQSLGLTSGGSLDLAGNALIVDYDDADPSPMGDFTAGNYTGLAGNVGAGAIFSSASDNPYRDLAVGEARDVLAIAPGETKLFGSQTVDDSAVLIKYTYVGDANLDGKLNIDDYVLIDSGVPLQLTGYANGDFNLDGKINIDDYVLIDANLPIQGPPLTWGSGVSPSAPDFPDLLADPAAAPAVS